MILETHNSLERIASPREVPRGSLMVDRAGYLRRVESSIHATGCGDSEARLITEVSGSSARWGLISSPDHEQVLPEHWLLYENPEPGLAISGLDSEGQPLEWAETSRQDCWNNAWEWFTIGSEDPVPATQIGFPIRAWGIE